MKAMNKSKSENFHVFHFVRINKMKKKGFMRVLEATVAVMIILGALLVISSNRGEVRAGRDLTETLSPYLEEIARDRELRGEIMLTYDTDKSYTDPANLGVLDKMVEFLKPRIGNPALEYEVRICDLGKVCPLEPYPDTEEEIFAAERVISATVDEGSFTPRKLKIFLWKKY